jgi:oligopeptide transport system ATP-binding protein
MATLIEINDLNIAFRMRKREVPVVRDVSFAIDEGESLGVLGESGSGKSVTVLAIMGLLDPKRSTVTGEVMLDGVNLLSLRESKRGGFRGGKIGMIFQDALAALNPVQPVGHQIGEVLKYHTRARPKAMRTRAIELMERVGIPAPESRYRSYAHELSGGMRQRIMIAMALAAGPRLLIADEPTTSLDVTVQAQIMQLLRDLRRETGMSIIFITHDLGLGLEIADRLAIMYAGRIVETGPAREVYRSPSHPYTQGLVESMPRRARVGERLTPIPGAPPAPLVVPAGCSFHPRCPRAIPPCATERPLLRQLADGRDAACHLAGEPVS